MKKSFRKSEYTILYKNAHTLGSPVSKNADLTVYEAKFTARSEREAVSMLKESRSYSVRNEKGKEIKGSRPFVVVRVTNGNPLMFKNYRGKMEQKYVRVLPTRIPRDLR